MTHAAGTGVLAGLRVTAQTRDRLERLARRIEKWNPAINLVARSTLTQIWSRHITDSAQVFAAAPPGFAHWADLGSGGGFPGLVACCLAADLAPDGQFTLVEADQRKAVFLREALRDLGLTARVLGERIESVPPLKADVLSARALAPLPQLCAFAVPHLAPGGVALFPKGSSYPQEIAEARKTWAFDLDILPSVTDPSAALLILKAITHV